ncbi:uncharacterized protein SCHCODRAFT_02632791 [Schizophyllum commune H4-8]|uniref:uncharacterized protein n=1 Tax=Schizophyllum commune (strain H4-8 / FGSC 9210) TaxID=578458 RepID=UPI002160905C|nr:uncharacterized protein SCHCODRAFT_02632791 [Schizophyllum commune H4-8]KAI5890755.1 hypothetical protein SCHCODRAFT_02632791 [Schizophyllum commune H4-8]
MGEERLNRRYPYTAPCGVCQPRVASGGWGKPTFPPRPPSLALRDDHVGDAQWGKPTVSPTPPSLALPRRSCASPTQALATHRRRPARPSTSAASVARCGFEDWIR